MKINSSYIVREIMGDFVLIPIGSKDNKSSLITFNECGKKIIELLTDDTDVEDIIAELKEFYSVGENELRVDVLEFLSRLREIGVLVD